MRHFDEILAGIGRFAPILVIHVLLLVWLSVRVLDPAQLQNVTPLWGWLSGNIDHWLGAVGLSVQRWYVLLALALAYLIAFEWACVFATSLPLLRAYRPLHMDSDLLARASVVLRMRPDYWDVTRAVRNQVDGAQRQAMAANQQHPFPWLVRRESNWRRYYGTLLVALIAVLGWRIAGAPLAQTPWRVSELAIILLAACIFTRLSVRKVAGRVETQLGHWALEEFVRANPLQPDATGGTRQDVMKREAQAERSIGRHPTWVLSRLIRRLPARLREPLFRKLAHPPRWDIESDWEIANSLSQRFADQPECPAAALRPNAFVDRFAALLECDGAGLCVLAPDRLGLAPAVNGRGSEYSFASRRHGGGYLAIRLEADASLDRAKLAVGWRSDGAGFIAEIGDWPIERLAGRDFDYRSGQEWHALIDVPLAEGSWNRLSKYKPTYVKGARLDYQTDLHVGSSYLLGIRTELGTRASAVLQCFRIPGERLLVAWRILYVDLTAARPRIRPWWNPASWREVARERPSVSP